jgi:hypothetical protein
MRTRYLLAAAVACLSASAGFAQTTGGGGTGTGGSTGGGISGLQTGSASSFEIQQMQSAPQIANATTSGSTLNSTNAFSQFYANPFYQGRAGATGQDGPGGFGSALTGTGGGGTGRAVGASGLNTGRTGATGTGGTGGGATGRTGGNTSVTGLGTGGRAGGTTGFGGTTGQFGGTTGQFGGRTGTTGQFGGRTGQLGGLGGTNQQQGNAVIPLPRPVSYTMTVRMPVPQMNTPQVQADLRGMIDRSSMIANPRGIALSMDGNTVVLRGTVKDQEEAQTVEGMVRLTPGVRTVKNELKY